MSDMDLFCEVAHAPDGPDDTLPWRAKVYRQSTDGFVPILQEVFFAATRKEVIDKAKKYAAWFRENRARGEELSETIDL